MLKTPTDHSLNTVSKPDGILRLPDIIVAVLDTGIDYLHEDLKHSMWVNQQEIPNNGKDDDGNGWVDDIYGVNTYDGNGDPYDGYRYYI